MDSDDDVHEGDPARRMVLVWSRDRARGGARSSVAFTSPAMHYGPGVGGNWHGFTFGAINRKLDRAVERLRREDKRYAERIEIPV